MSKAPFVTAQEIEQYLDLEERLRALQREARDLDKQAELIEERLMEFVRVNGGPGRSVKRSGFVLALLSKKGSVAWKPEFVRVAGQEAAEQLIQAAPTREALSVERI